MMRMMMMMMMMMMMVIKMRMMMKTMTIMMMMIMKMMTNMMMLHAKTMMRPTTNDEDDVSTAMPSLWDVISQLPAKTQHNPLALSREPWHRTEPNTSGSPDR